MQVSILSRKVAKELIATQFPKNTAVISFYDPPSKRHKDDYGPLNYQGKCERLFRVAIHDIDIDILEDYGLTYDTYLPEVNELAQYILSAKQDGLDIICQCEYGQSRSAACAAAIKEYFDHSGISVFADYRYYPNQLVFNKVLNALKEQGGN